MDKIIIRGLNLFAFHGVNPEEKKNGQTFYLDVTCYADLKKACHSDKLEDTVNYAKAVKIIRRVFTERSYDLIERAAQAVADGLLSELDAVQKVEVLLKKPEAPVSADFEYMAVQIERERQTEKGE